MRDDIMSMRDLLRAIGPANNYTDIHKLIADIKEEVEDKPGVEEEISEAIQEKLDVLETSIDQLSDYILKIQESHDRFVLPNLKNQINDSIENYTAAYDATMFYTKGWFSRQYLSVEGKVELARYLLEVIKPYCKSNLETLKLIHGRQPDIILYITYPRDDD